MIVLDSVSLDVKDDDGNSLFESEGYQFLSITIEENPGKFPVLTLKIDNLVASRACDLEEITGTIKKEGETLNFTASRVDTVTRPDEPIVFTSKAMTSMDMNERGSEYLGDSLDSAIEALKIRDEVIGVDAIAGEYFRFNETREECCLRLLRGARPDAILAIGLSSINVMDRDDPSGETYEFIAPDTIRMTKVNDYLSNEDDLRQYNNDEFDTVTWGDTLSLIVMDNIDFAYNVATNEKSKDPPKFMMIGSYSDDFELKVGDIMTNSMPNYPYSSFYVMGKITEITSFSVKCKVIFGGIE